MTRIPPGMQSLEQFARNLEEHFTEMYPTPRVGGTAVLSLGGRFFIVAHFPLKIAHDEWGCPESAATIPLGTVPSGGGTPVIPDHAAVHLINHLSGAGRTVAEWLLAYGPAELWRILDGEGPDRSGDKS